MKKSIINNLKKDIYDKQKELLYAKFEFYNQSK